jgi:transglutaminase-like putative cysteine protease
MRVWTDYPQNLRARAYLGFDGRSWRAAPGISSPLQTVASDALPDVQVHDWLEQIPGASYTIARQDNRQISRSWVRTRIIQNLAFNNGMMVSPGNKLLVRTNLTGLRVDSQENLQPVPGGELETYGILNDREDDVVQWGTASPEELKEALELPENTDARLHVLAQRLALGTSSPEEKVKNTLNLLQQDYQYTLRVGTFHTSQPVAEFLFEKKKGYCQYFASAAAVLLRLEGVPTRYVSGFHVTENNRVGNHYLVREMDAHAWVESYIPGKGWVQVDPTPGAEYHPFTRP